MDSSISNTASTAAMARPFIGLWYPASGMRELPRLWCRRCRISGTCARVRRRPGPASTGSTVSGRRLWRSIAASRRAWRPIRNCPQIAAALSQSPVSYWLREWARCHASAQRRYWRPVRPPESWRPSRRLSCRQLFPSGLASFLLWVAELGQRNTVSAAFISIVTHLVDALSDDVGAESGLARAVEHRRRRRRRVERVSEVTQPDHHMPRKRFGIEVNALIGAAMVGVFHDVAGCFVDGQFERAGAAFMQWRTG